MNYYSTYESPIGVLYMVSDGEYLISLEFDLKEERLLKYVNKDNIDVFSYTINWLDHYFKNGEVLPLPKLKIQGSEFHQIVEKILLEIPFGKAMSYKEIALKVSKINQKKPCAQAVGQSIGKNEFLIMVPCHRVLGKNKELTGFSCGVERKKYLLNFEKIEYID